MNTTQNNPTQKPNLIREEVLIPNDYTLFLFFAPPNTKISTENQHPHRKRTLHPLQPYAFLPVSTITKMLIFYISYTEFFPFYSTHTSPNFST